MMKFFYCILGMKNMKPSTGQFLFSTAKSRVSKCYNKEV